MFVGNLAQFDPEELEDLLPIPTREPWALVVARRRHHAHGSSVALARKPKATA
jgi:hypothetical protein